MDPTLEDSEELLQLIETSALRNYVFAKEITRENVSEIIALILTAYGENPEIPFTLYFSTHGGDTSAAYALYDVLQLVKPMEVNIVVIGNCFSAGLMILAGATNRYSTPNSMFLHHRTSFQTEQCSVGKLNELINHLSRYSEETDNLVYSRLNKKQIKALEKRIGKEEDVYLRADEALQYGLIDKVIRNLSEIEDT